MRRLLERFVPHDDIVIYGDVYMRRYHFLKTRWFRVRIHHIRLPDYGRHVHDHPFAFLTVGLRGGYWELLSDGTYVRHQPGTVRFRQAEFAHTIRQVSRDGVWTLVFTGRIKREWGFYVDGDWIHHSDYVLEGDTV